jgi:hypothetical protein
MTYYLPNAARAWIEVIDSSGRRIRCLEAPGDAGLHRTAWDLRESAPVEWLAAREWNRGGEGPTVVPGHYTVRLHAAGGIADQPLEIRPDPRASWTQAQYVARYTFVKSLDDELSAIDVALNRLDGLLSGPSTPALRASAQDDKRTLTSGVINSEDDQLTPDRLRERLTILQGAIALSQGPPLPPHYREAAAIHAQFENSMASYRALLAAHNLPPDAKTGGCR